MFSLGQDGPHLQLKVPEPHQPRAARSVIDSDYRDTVERYRTAKSWTISKFADLAGVDERTLRKFRKTARIGFETRTAIDACMQLYPA